MLVLWYEHITRPNCWASMSKWFYSTFNIAPDSNLKYHFISYNFYKHTHTHEADHLLTASPKWFWMCRYKQTMNILLTLLKHCHRCCSYFSVPGHGYVVKSSFSLNSYSRVFFNEAIEEVIVYSIISFILNTSRVCKVLQSPGWDYVSLTDNKVCVSSRSLHTNYPWPRKLYTH